MRTRASRAWAKVTDEALEQIILTSMIEWERKGSDQKLDAPYLSKVTGISIDRCDRVLTRMAKKSLIEEGEVQAEQEMKATTPALNAVLSLMQHNPSWTLKQAIEEVLSLVDKTGRGNDTDIPQEDRVRALICLIGGTIHAGKFTWRDLADQIS